MIQEVGAPQIKKKQTKITRLLYFDEVLKLSSPVKELIQHIVWFLHLNNIYEREIC